MELTASTDISVMDRAKIQARVLLPLIRTLRRSVSPSDADTDNDIDCDDWAISTPNAEAPESHGIPGLPQRFSAPRILERETGLEPATLSLGS